MCLRSTFFSYGGKFYQEKHGAVMGSPVSAIVAHLYMKFLEQLAWSTAPVKPRIWKRYVDDTFCIVEKGKELELLDHLISIRPMIKFTFELEEQGELPFLDYFVRRVDDSFSVSVCRKATHTDKFSDFTPFMKGVG